MKDKKKLTEHQQNLVEQLAYGDVSALADALGVNRVTISGIVNGRISAPHAWVYIEAFVKTTNKMRKERQPQLLEKVTLAAMSRTCPF